MLVSPKRYGISFKLITWEDGTDEDIAGMIDAADKGKITLTDYWAVGDERTFSLNNNDVIMVLMNEGYNYQKNINFVVGQKNVFEQNTSSCSTYLNTDYLNYFPEIIRSIFKDFKIPGGSTPIKLSLFSMSEIHNPYSFATTTSGSYTYMISYTSTESKETMEYYNTSSNRIKSLVNQNTNIEWWSRSKGKRQYNNGWGWDTESNVYMYTKADGTHNWDKNSSTQRYLAPFGCI